MITTPSATQVGSTALFAVGYHGLGRQPLLSLDYLDRTNVKDVVSKIPTSDLCRTVRISCWHYVYEVRKLNDRK